MSPHIDLSLEGAATTERALAERLTGQSAQLLTALGLAHRPLSLLLTGDPEIQALNAQWRDEDTPTDVLSFPMDDPDDDPRTQFGPLGDIVLSVETLQREAEKIGWRPPLLASFLLVHSICHLLGHDHAEPEEAALMRAEEDRLFALIAPGEGRPPTPY